MKKRSEWIHVDYVYDSREERDEHVKWMESEGFECSGQIKETQSLYSSEFVWIGKFSKRLCAYD